MCDMRCVCVCVFGFAIRKRTLYTIYIIRTQIAFSPMRFGGFLRIAWHDLFELFSLVMYIQKLSDFYAEQVMSISVDLFIKSIGNYRQTI